MIREARPYDLETLLNLSKKFHKQTKYNLMFDGVKVRETLENLIESPQGVVFCYEHQGRVVGFLAGVVSPSFFAFNEIATELAWFVDKPYRKGTKGIRLIEAFENWADEKQCSHISLAMIDGLTDLDRIYTRRGYKRSEAVYVKET